MRFAMLAAALLPALVLLLFFWERDRFGTVAETVWSAFAIGAVVAFPVISVGVFVIQPVAVFSDPYMSAFGKAFISAALPEEAFKLIALLTIYLRHHDVHRPYDLMLLSVAISAGFGALENIMYVDEARDWGAVAMVRSVTAVPGHAFFGAIMGAMVAYARYGHRSSPMFWAAAFLLPFLLHGIYDFLIFLPEETKTDFGWATTVFICVVIGSGMIAVSLAGKVRKWSVESYPENLQGAATATTFWQRSFLVRRLVWCVPSALLVLVGVGFVAASALSKISDLEIATEKWTHGAIAAGLFCIFHGTAFFVHGLSVSRRR